MTREQLALLAYLDQEQAELAQQWADTEPAAALEIIQWLDADMPADVVVPGRWREFISRVALVAIQRSAIPRT